MQKSSSNQAATTNDSFVSNSASGKDKKDSSQAVSGTGAIFEFFKKLTSGELKVDSEDKIIPFSIFISTYRRKKILAAMMGKTSKEKEEGARILNNYKKQLAEKLAREKAERGEALSSTSYSKGNKSNAMNSKVSDKKSVKSTKSSKRNQGGGAADINSVEAMEPEILLRILHGQGGLGSASASHSKK